MSASTISSINPNDIDDDTKYLLHGYIRNIQKSIDNIIPDIIINVILSFYYISEYFHIFEDKYYKIVKDNNQIIQCIKSHHDASIYGNILIDCDGNQQRYIWSFRINKKYPTNHFYIGISSTYETMQRYYWNTLSSNYCLQLDGYKWSKDHPQEYTKEKFENGDIVDMILDLNLRQLSFMKNGTINLKVAYKNIDIEPKIKYRMAIRMDNEDDELELIGFKCCKYKF